MNKRQLEVQKALNQNEKKVIQLLKMVYQQASTDCETRIRELAGRTDMENLQAIIYQKQYQEVLKKQLDGILDTLQNKEFETIAEYLTGCYEDGFIGALYDIHGQGVPLIFPIDQRQVVEAVQTDSKISTSLYTRLGEDVNRLKKSIRAELSRGISNGSTWVETAEHIARGMNSPFRKAMNLAMRIARTEGHRIQNRAQMDTLNKAKEKGADVVKQWISTLDDRTRETHKILDGQIREVEDYFEINGHKALHPGGFGVASEDIHCRCCMGQRAKWALDQDELDTLKERAAYFGLDKSKDFEDFKKKYIATVEKVPEVDIIKKNGDIPKMNLQYFAERDIRNQESSSLKRAIRKYEKRIKEHENKINSPEAYISGWNEMDPRRQEGLKKHWNKEIRNFNQSIQDRLDELKARGGL